jgi:hypothetical protein
MPATEVKKFAISGPRSKMTSRTALLLLSLIPLFSVLQAQAQVSDRVVQSNGRMVHEMYPFKVKGPEESQYPWDYYKLLARIPGTDAFATPSESGCPAD